MLNPDLLARMKAYGDFLDRAIAELGEGTPSGVAAQQRLAAMPLLASDLQGIGPRQPELAPVRYPFAEAAE